MNGHASGCFADGLNTIASELVWAFEKNEEGLSKDERTTRCVSVWQGSVQGYGRIAAGDILPLHAMP
jgi:hypothetical protein